MAKSSEIMLHIWIKCAFTFCGNIAYKCFLENVFNALYNNNHQ